jgi:hypothetical protein
MPFEKGMTKSGGRKLGVQNRATGEIKEFAASILEDETYQARLRQRIINGESPQVEQLLYHYLYGKPKTELELSRKPIVVHVNR